MLPRYPLLLIPTHHLYQTNTQNSHLDSPKWPNQSSVPSATPAPKNTNAPIAPSHSTHALPDLHCYDAIFNQATDSCSIPCLKTHKPVCRAQTPSPPKPTPVPFPQSHNTTNFPNDDPFINLVDNPHLNYLFARYPTLLSQLKSIYEQLNAPFDPLRMRSHLEPSPEALELERLVEIRERGDAIAHAVGQERAALKKLDEEECGEGIREFIALVDSVSVLEGEASNGLDAG